MHLYLSLIIVLFLALGAGCGGRHVSMPGETPVYTISCDNSLEDCYSGAQQLCGGAYELETAPLTGKPSAAGSFGWVDTKGDQHDMGGVGGKHSIRIRCK